MNKLINCDALEWLHDSSDKVRMLFGDPPDNIRLGYKGFKDKCSDEDYEALLSRLLYDGSKMADVIWLSVNPIHAPLLGHITYKFTREFQNWLFKPCVQTYTFGQSNKHDLGCGHRLLYRYMKKGAQLYPEAIRVPSWRQVNGDKRANPNGKVPLDTIKLSAKSLDHLPIPVMTDKDIERFLSHIDRSNSDGCWEWKATKRSGYGRFRLGGSLYGATRIMWRLTHGSDPKSSFICHICDNPACCNPDHLFLGSLTDNNRDKETKGRGNHPIGEANGLSKLSDQDVMAIYQSTDKSVDLAARYAVTDVCVNSIRNEKTWTHVTSELNLRDVFNIPRVTGNSKQRRKFSPTQLNERLYERCIKLCCAPGDHVVDLFAGSGTLGRVGERCEVNTTMLEISRETCDNILADQPNCKELK